MPLRYHGGGTDTKKESAHKVNSREENSPAAPAEIQTRNFRSRVRRSYQQAIPISTKWVSDSNHQLGPFGSCWEGCYIWESGINDTVSKVKWPRDSRPDIHRLVSGTKEIPCSILIRPRTRRCSFWSLNLAARGSGMSRATRVSPKPSFKALWRVSDAVVSTALAGLKAPSN